MLRGLRRVAALQEMEKQREAAVELRGADFDWSNWAGLPPAQLAERRAAAAALLQDPAAARHPCLDWQRLFRAKPQKPRSNPGSDKLSTARVSPAAAAAQPGGRAGDAGSALAPGATASFGAPDTRLALGAPPETANDVQQIVVTLPDVASDDLDAHARHALVLVPRPVAAMCAC